MARTIHTTVSAEKICTRVMAPIYPVNGGARSQAYDGNSNPPESLEPGPILITATTTTGATSTSNTSTAATNSHEPNIGPPSSSCSTASAYPSAVMDVRRPARSGTGGPSMGDQTTDCGGEQDREHNAPLHRAVDRRDRDHRRASDENGYEEGAAGHGRTSTRSGRLVLHQLLVPLQQGPRARTARR
jgi:hypothetical protein